LGQGKPIGSNKTSKGTGEMKCRGEVEGTKKGEGGFTLKEHKTTAAESKQKKNVHVNHGGEKGGEIVEGGTQPHRGGVQVQKKS